MPPPIVDETGEPRRGHDVDGESGTESAFQYRASYYLESERDAASLKVHLLNLELNEVASLSGQLAKNTPHLDKDIYTPS